MLVREVKGGRILAALLLILIVVLLYLLLWPVPIEPVAWWAPPNPGYTGPFAPNERLKGVEVFPIRDNLQDPDGGYRLNTSVTETKDYLYIGSFVMPSLGRLSKSTAGAF